MTERRDPLEPTNAALLAAYRVLWGKDPERDSADEVMCPRDMERWGETLEMLRAAYAIDRRGTGAEPTAGLTEIAEEFIATHFASTMPFRVWAERFAGALRGGGPAPEYDVLAMVVPYVKHDTNCTARTGDGLCICGMQTAMERLQRALSSGGPAREEPLADVRQMLKRLLEQTEEDLRGRVRGDPMYDYHSGAKVTLLAVLNYEPLRRALSSGLPAPEEAHG